MRHMPKVSIGLPVFNGAAYLEQAIESIVSQTFADFELIIADNCSTDDSLAIAYKWRDSDARILVLESEKNLGAAPNFNRAFHAARAKYFKWAACDDVLDSEFLQRCFDAMENNSNIVLVYSDALDIDEAGKVIGPIYDSKVAMKVDSIDPVLRFKDLVLNNHSCISAFGLCRSTALRRTGLIGSYVGSDRVLLSQLGLIGRFCRIDEPLILHREHKDRSTRAIPDSQDRALWFDSSLKGAKTFPHWRILKEYFLVLLKSELRVSQRISCSFHLFRWIRWGGWRDLIADLESP